MSTWIKICGLSTPATVDAAVGAGVDAVGFVFAPGSPRLVDVETARALAARVPDGVETVGVFRGQAVSQVVATAGAARLTTVQLHGAEGPADAAAVRAAGFSVVRALGIDTWLAEGTEAGEAFGVHRLMLDAVEPGGGRTFDPAPLSATRPVGDWVLAGGLDVGNVAGLLRLLGPSGVDVSSGVESSRGVKDVGAIRDFVAEVRRVAA